MRGLASLWEDTALPSHAWERASWGPSPRDPEHLQHEYNTLLLEQECMLREGQKLALLTGSLCFPLPEAFNKDDLTTIGKP